MSEIAAVKQVPEGRPGRSARRWLGHPVLAVAAAALLSGCVFAKRDSIEVGSVPDDYRTNHPIVISEGEEVLDLPVGASSYGMTENQRAAIEGFLDRYDPDASPWVTILVPVGSNNEAAASQASDDFAEVIRAEGVPSGRLMVRSYHAASAEVSAPVRMSYAVMEASTGPCGRWPADMLETTDNKHYANFGCAIQNNLAAQVDNPSDFLGPRKPSPIDAENRDAAIGVYKSREVSGEFQSGSEVDF